MVKTPGTRKTWLARAIGGAAIAGLLVTGSVVPGVHASPAHAGTTITLWAPYSGPDQNGVKKIVADFNNSNSGVTVSYDEQSQTNYGTKLTTALSAGKGPDIWVTDNTTMTTYANQGVLQALDSQVKSDKTVNAKNFPKSIWNGGKYNGHLYAIPLDVLPLTMYYNKAMFKKAGLNPNKPPIGSQAQFLAAAKKLTKGGKYGFMVPPAWPEPFVFPTLLAQFGAKEFNVSSKKSGLTSPAAVKALTFLRDLIYKYKVSPPNTAVDQDWKSLANGTVGMILDGPWEYTNPTLASLGKNLGYSVVPKFGTKKAVFLGTHYLVVYAKDSSSDRINGAMKFAAFWSKHSIEMAKEGDTPAYNPVLKTKAFKALKFQKTIAPMLKYAVLSPNFPAYHGEYRDQEVESVLRGKTKDVKGALATAASKINQAAQSSG